MQNEKGSTYNIIPISIFALCVLIILFFFPKEKRFAYDFSLGTLWLHDDLYANEDFSIFKTDAEIELEKEDIIHDQIPYYIKDNTVDEKVKSYINKDVFDIGKKSFHDYAEINNLNRTQEISNVYILKYFCKKLDSITNNILTVGVVDFPDSITNLESFKFFLLDEEVSELSLGSDFYMKNQLKTEIDNLYFDLPISRIDSLSGNKVKNSIDDYFPVENISYDVSINNDIVNNAISNISKSSGMVKKGELIIRKGSYVGEKENKILISYQNRFDSDNHNKSLFWVTLGSFILLSFVFMGFYLFFYNYQKKILISMKNLLFILSNIVLLIICVYLTSTKTEFDLNVLPFVLFPLLVITFYSFKVSFFTFFTAILLSGFFAANSFEFLFTQVIVGTFAMLVLKNSQKRSQLFLCILIVFISYAGIALGFQLIKHGTIRYDFLNILLNFAISSILLILYLPLVYVFERVFGLLSSYTLMEYSDTNNAILRLLSEKAPSTFQHSVQVANIAESVVRELGGNYLLVRAGALYHDIGKLEHPEYFIENQEGLNVLDKLDNVEGAKKIISHVQEGLEIAKKYKLSKKITDFIAMHHGTSITRFFYNSWMNEHPGETIDSNLFRYPGPKPNSLETVVLMMTDSIEAASRTLKEYSDDSIRNLIDKIIETQMKDGQYDDVNITLKQIRIAKEIFFNKIHTIYHSRIEYPEIEQNI